MTINLCQIIPQKKEINAEYVAFWVTESFHVCDPQTRQFAAIVVLLPQEIIKGHEIW